MNTTLVKGLCVSAVTFALSLGVILGALRLYASWLGITDLGFRYENQIKMWDSESTIGFRNLPNFSAVSFFNVQVHTNERGFRGTRRVMERTEGVSRIVGMGDSVMWGTGVNEQNSILGYLEKALTHKSSYEIINTGVVGYSSYQELLYFQKYVLPLRPDVVLVNYCENDLLPTEDPFLNVREMSVQYLGNILENHANALSPDEKLGLEQVIRIFNSSERVWHAVNELKIKAPDLYSLIWKLFVSVPIGRMAELSRQFGVRLVFVFIPPQRNHGEYVRNVEELKRLLISKGAEFVDLQSALAPEPHELIYESPSDFAWVWPRELKQILMYRTLERARRRNKFLDSVHPTDKGNAIIAGHVYRYLIEGADSKK